MTIGRPAGAVRADGRGPGDIRPVTMSLNVLKWAEGSCRIRVGDTDVLCAATISESQVDRATGAVVPKVVELNWPSQKMELKMKLSDVAVNRPIDERRAALLFNRPAWKNVPSYDLAKGRFDQPTGRVQRASGYNFR